jgi:hypothetical protein
MNRNGSVIQSHMGYAMPLPELSPMKKRIMDPLQVTSRTLELSQPEICECDIDSIVEKKLSTVLPDLPSTIPHTK